MAVIHRTTLKPTKLELLASWLPSRPWYRGGTGEPELVKSGGFRLDDPQGEVGIEFMVVTDVSGPQPAAYLVPLTYRGAVLEQAEHALIGTAEHGVLGRRWVYDGCHDPVLVSQLLALIEGRVQAQDQNISGAPDRQVTRVYRGAALASGEFAAAVDDREGTGLAGPHGAVMRVSRFLRPNADDAAAPAPEATGHVAGCWQTPDGDRVRGLFVAVHAGSHA